MVYWALARTYRPTTFADIVGQEPIVRTLSNAIALNRVYHAYLFTGSRGVGKTTTARIIARALNCQQGPSVTPCGVCRSCQAIGEDRSPDVLEIDGASNTGVNHVRDLKDRLGYLPQLGPYRIYIIDEVHMLSTAAFHALLKTLEEPPSHVKFVLATTEFHKIPGTIVSRCQRFDFRKVGMAVLSLHLQTIVQREGLTVGPQILGAIARQAQGSVRDALSLLDQALSYAGDRISKASHEVSPETLPEAQMLEALGMLDRQTVWNICEAIFHRDAQQLLSLIADVEARGHDLEMLAFLLVEHLRDLAVVRWVETPSEALMDRSLEDIEALKAQAHTRSTADLQRLFGEAVAVAEDVGRSSMPKVTLEMGLLRLLEVAPVADITHLLERLDALASGALGPETPDAARPAPVMLGSEPSLDLSKAASSLDPFKAKMALKSSWGAPRPDEASPDEASPDEASPDEASDEPSEAPQVSLVSSKPTGKLTGKLTGEPLAGKPTGEPLGTSSEGPEAWRALVDRVRTVRPALASVLEHGHVLRCDANQVEVGFVEGTFYWDAACEEENHALIGQMAQAQWGREVAWQVVALQKDRTGSKSLVDLDEMHQKSSQEQVRQEALRHVSVQNAISILEGEVEDIRPLGHT